MSHHRIVLLGAPGSGKGTAAEALSELLGVPHVSTGQMFRETVRKGGLIGSSAKQFIDIGQLVPDEITIEIVRLWLDEHVGGRGFIFDGFPRTLPQAQAFDRLLAGRGTPITMAILLDVTDEEIVERILGRLSCETCGALYHVTRMRPQREGVCDKCGGKLVRRADDTEATIRERMRVYQEQTLGVVEHYEKRGVLKRVDGSGLKDKAFSAIIELVQP
ncbi:MAG TPA: adenylate kinase [Verrucomicrobiae bacterium]|nr:adenylate kinase [Verrucomicrobiae bacterium]